MIQYIETQIVIIGGGIAGLWLLSVLKTLGYDALLCEKTALGNGQTIASQGIIHGGTKYALKGKMTAATNNISGMPAIWKAALTGQKTPNLTKTKILSEHQYLWTTKNIASNITTFFASKLMKSKMIRLNPIAYPPIFQSPNFKNTVYQLQEQVLDIPSVLKQFQTNLRKNLIHSKNITIQKRPSETEIILTTIEQKTYSIKTKYVVCLAGEGNQDLVKNLGFEMPIMQSRPLQMLLMRGNLPKIYGHALGIDDLPRITITTHFDKNNKTVWYMGGRPAEKGVGMSATDLIVKTKKELQRLIPWIDFSETAWATWKVNRAEGFQKNGKRPAVPILKTKGNIGVAWPTKLAFTPLLSQQIIQWISDLEPKQKSDKPIFPTPPTATPIWDRTDINFR